MDNPDREGHPDTPQVSPMKGINLNNAFSPHKRTQFNKYVRRRAREADQTPISVKRLSKAARTRASPVDKDEMYAYVKEEMAKVEARMLECMTAFKSEMMGEMHTLGISMYAKWEEEMQTYSQKEMTAQLKAELVPLEGKIHAFMAKDMLKLAHEGLKAEGKAMKEACKQEVSTAVENEIQKSKEAIATMEASVSKVQETVEKKVHTWAGMMKDAVDKEVKECAPWIEVVKKNKGMPSNQTEVMNATLEEEAKRKKMHAVTYESMYEELLDTHQRVYDRDVEKVSFSDRNRILNRQVKDLKKVISSLNLQLREAQEQLQQKSMVTTMVCNGCAEMELTVTTPTPVATISLPTQGIPTTYSGGVSLASKTLPGSQEQTKVVTSMPLPPHGVFTCPLPRRPFAGASTYAPSMPATPFVSSSAPIQPNPALYSSHFGTLPQYHVQLPTPHHWPSPSQALISSSASLQPNPALYSSHFGTLPGYHMALPPPHHLPSLSQAQAAYSIYPNLGFGPYNHLPYNYPPAP
ncbi:hypothetical protein L7F22_025836 [Adiantum nelumboides]|nr:hypothetical protein [Adiantum nelumboides]